MLAIIIQYIGYHCTDARFASSLSGGFTTMEVMNPPESKLAKLTSVQWVGGMALGHFKQLIKSKIFLFILKL